MRRVLFKPCTDMHMRQAFIWARPRQLSTAKAATRQVPAGVTVVNSAESAGRVLDLLRKHADRAVAWDTETSDMLKGKSFDETWGKLKCICLSAYAGDDIDFGSGPRLWLDNHGEAAGTLDRFREYFEDQNMRKIWHNYSFDGRVLYWSLNTPARPFVPRGLAADTLHMARLWDTSRFKGSGFSLEALTKDLVPNEKHKIPMSVKFGKPNVRKDGSEGSKIEVPGPLTLQTDPATRADFIDYSTGDAESTWRLYQALSCQLQQQPWEKLRQGTMLDFYNEFWVPFGQLLVEMELNGIAIDRAHLNQAEERAGKDLEMHLAAFMSWAQKVCPDAQHMNVRSVPQKMQLLFAPVRNSRDPSKRLERQKELDVENRAGYICPDRVRDHEQHLREVDAKEAERDRKDAERRASGKKVQPRKPLKRKLPPKALKNRQIVLRGLGLPVIKTTVSGWPSCDEQTLRGLVGGKTRETSPAFSSLLDALGTEEKVLEGLNALESLAEFISIDKLRSSYLANMKDAVCPDGRMRSSLNINTETGRLSSRNPNLQSQPALDKDRYGIRRAFVAEPGNSLIVLDYGQLELRVLASMTNCQSMIEAFDMGGDFHSRTAMGMYTHVEEAVKGGKVVLERATESSANLPLLKDVYKTERKNAKVLNFAIAYGMTVHGLVKALDVTKREAHEVQARWYADRPEVRRWQNAVQDKARKVKYCETILGRRRVLIHMMSEDQQLKGHHERACINSPIQGGAADIVMCAMIGIHGHSRLRELGWRLILQIHDEVILEGPSDSAAEAFEITSKLMQDSFPMELPVKMIVDGNVAQNWGEAK